MKKRETKKADPIKNQMVQSTKYGNLTSILVIVESPAKCSKIESYLGDGYKCVASFGHLRQISALESIDINNNFATKYDIISDLKKLLSSIKSDISSENTKNSITVASVASVSSASYNSDSNSGSDLHILDS